MTTEYLWCRQIRASLGSNTDISNAIRVGAMGADFRIDFDVKKTRDSSANTCALTIYNLDSNTRRSIDNEYDRITLEAGYGDDVLDDRWPVIFDGWTKKITHSRNGVDTVSRIECVDGGLDYSDARVNETYSPDSTYRSIISDISRKMNFVKIGDISGIPSNATISSQIDGQSRRSRTFSGQSRKAIEQIAHQFDSRMTIENGILDIISNNSAKTEGYTVPIIRANSGMIGSPSVTEKGIQVDCLLFPEIRPNNLIYVVDDFLGSGRSATALPEEISTSLEGGGVYRVNSVRLTGSNYSGQFKCSIEAQKSDGHKIVRPPNDVSPFVRRS